MTRVAQRLTHRSCGGDVYVRAAGLMESLVCVRCRATVELEELEVRADGEDKGQD